MNTSGIVRAQITDAMRIISLHFLPGIRQLTLFFKSGGLDTKLPIRLTLKMINQRMQYQFLMTKGADWTDAPLMQPYLALRNTLLDASMGLIAEMVSVVPPHTASVMAMWIFVLLCEVIGFTTYPVGVPRPDIMSDSAQVSCLASVMDWVLERSLLQPDPAPWDDAEGELWRVLIMDGVMLFSLLCVLDPDDLVGILHGRLRHTYILERTLLMMSIYLPHMDDRPAACGKKVYLHALRSCRIMFHGCSSEAHLRVSPFAQHLCRLRLCSEDTAASVDVENLEDMLIILSNTSSMPAIATSERMTLWLTKIEPVGASEFLRALVRCASRTLEHCHLNIVINLISLVSVELGDEGHDASLLCMLRIIGVYVRTVSRANNVGCRGTCLLAILVLTRILHQTTLTLHQGLLSVCDKPGTSVMLDTLFRARNLDMGLAYWDKALSCCMACAPMHVTDSTRPAYWSLAGTLRKVAVRGLEDREARRHTRMHCLRLLRRLPRGAGYLRLSATVASVLSIAAGGLMPEDLVTEERAMRDVFPLNVRDLLSDLLGRAPVPQPREQWREWDRFAADECPNMLPGCGYWLCQEYSGISEAAMPTLLCSGCQRVRYCSTRCQRSAWVLGHREMCAPADASKSMSVSVCLCV